nr:MAG TPA: hypothetical protein [Caudoviricetes sp.]
MNYAALKRRGAIPFFFIMIIPSSGNLFINA